MNEKKWCAMGKPAQWSLLTLLKVVRCLRKFTCRPYHCVSWSCMDTVGMQPMLKSPDFGTGFYMFYGDNARNIWTLNSASFYDRFYNQQENRTSSQQMTHASPYKFVQEEDSPMPRQKEEVLSHDRCSADKEKSKNSELDIICVSPKRRFSEIEHENEDIQEINFEEASSSKRHKKHKKRKHKHQRSDEKKEVSNIETTDDIICVDDSLAVDEIDKFASDKDIKIKHHKRKKHKHKHKREEGTETVTKAVIEDIVCIDDSTENLDIEETAFQEGGDKQPGKSHSQRRRERQKERKRLAQQPASCSDDTVTTTLQTEKLETEEENIEKFEHQGKRNHERRKGKRELVKDVIGCLDSNPSTTFEAEDDTHEKNTGEYSSHNQRRRQRQRERRKMKFDNNDSFRDNEYNTVDLTNHSPKFENLTFQIPEIFPEQATVTEPIESVTTVDVNNDLWSLNTTIDTPSDMDIAKSPSVGGIYYASELEQDWQNNADRDALPSVNNVHYVTDMEKQWQQDSVRADLNQSQSGSHRTFDPWQQDSDSRVGSSHQWTNQDPSRTWDIAAQQWQDQFVQGFPTSWQDYRSLNQFQTRNTHTSSDCWQSDSNQASSILEIDMSKPYSGSQGWLRRRQWEYTDYGKEKRSGGGKGKTFDFTVATYNVLAQNLISENPYLYNRCHAEYLRWEYRSQNLLHEISELSPDVLCMQEVNVQHCDEFFVPQLKKLGYEGVFKKRTGDKHDGCATFWKENKFQLDKSVPVEYFKPGVHVLDRDNVALLVLLKPKGKIENKGFKVCVANTHLLFNPRRGDIKLAQAMLLMAEIEKLSFTRHLLKTGHEKYHPTLLCGDFNCEPFCDLYKLFGRGILNYDGLLQRNISGQEEGRLGGRDIYMDKRIIPQSIGITDKCQYIEEVRARWSKFIEHQKSRDQNNTANERPVKLEFETVDLTDETATLSPKSLPVDTKEDDAEVIIDITDDKSEKAKSPPKGETSEETPQHGNSNKSLAEETSKTVQFEEPSFSQCTGILSHKAKFVSVYDHEHQNGRHYEKEATTHHGRANCTVDYIFYSVESRQTRTHKKKFKYHAVNEGRLRLVAKLILPSERKLDSAGCLPNQAVSSDHTILMAKFALNLSKK